LYTYIICNENSELDPHGMFYYNVYYYKKKSYNTISQIIDIILTQINYNTLRLKYFKSGTIYLVFIFFNVNFLNLIFIDFFS